MDRARSLRRDMARDAAREAELLEQPLHAALVLRHMRIGLGVGAFEPGGRNHSRPAMPGTGDVDHVEVAPLDDPVQMHIDEVQSRRGAPMAEQPRLDMREFERLFQERVVEQINLSDGQVIRRAPPRIDQAQFLGRERAGNNSRVAGVIHRLLPKFWSSSRRVCRATIKFSSVGMTQAETPELALEIRGPPAWLAASLSMTPSHCASWHTRARIGAACSPMPPVKTSASSPPSADTSDPSSRPMR